MSLLIDRFHKPLPTWIPNIKKDVRRKVESSPIIQGCARGDVSHVRALITGYWPFVDAFPKIIFRTLYSTKKYLLKPHFILTFGPLMLRGIHTMNAKVTKEIQSDEAAHRDLWIQTAAALGLTIKDLRNQKAIPEILHLNETVGEGTDFFIRYLRFVAVEMVAEEISRVLLASAPFSELVGESGQEWFHVHILHDLHEGMSHEELALRLAWIFYFIDHQSEEPQEKDVSRTIHEMVDLFDAVGKALSA